MKIKLDTNDSSVADLQALWALVGTLIEQRDPDFFKETQPVKPSINPEAGTTINGPTEPVVLMPRDTLPPNVVPILDAVAAMHGLPPLIPPPVAARPIFIPPLPTFPDAPQWPAATALASSTATNAPPMIPPPPGPPAAPELDSAGVAHDPNLHSSKRGKTIDGKWRARRNVTPAVPAGTTPASALPVPPMIPPPPTVMVHSTEPDDSDDVASGTGGVPSADAVPGLDFATFIERLTQAMNAGTVTQARIAEVTAKHELDSLFSLNLKPALVPVVAVDLGL